MGEFQNILQGELGAIHREGSEDLNAGPRGSGRQVLCALGVLGD